MTDHRNYVHNCLSFRDIMYLLTEREGRTGKYLAWGQDVWSECSEVQAPWAKLFPVWPDLTQSISILSYDHYLFSFSFFFLVERGRTPQHCFVSCAFSKSQCFHAIHFLSLWSVLQVQVVYKLKNTNTLSKFWSKRPHFGKCHLNLLQHRETVRKRDQLYKTCSQDLFLF